MEQGRVYLDHAATTPLRPEALAAMLPFLTEHFGNPSGSHAVARRAKRAIEEARDVVAAALGCHPGEVVFTGGGTEADNLAILGRVRAVPGRAVCSAVEHHAVLHATEAAPHGGTVVPVTAGGTVDLDALAAAIDEDARVSVVSVMLANNEVGVVQPIEDVVRVVKERAPGAAVHTDAVQAFPWVDVAQRTQDCDLVAVSAHKFGGPKGVGALVVRRGTAIAPIVHGGGQEAERRSGTHDVAGIVGLAAAAEATVRGRAATVERVRGLRDRLLDALHAALPPGAVTETGDRSAKVAGNAHVRITGVESEALLVLLDDAGVCASAGSACASGAVEPSHVLTAMGIERQDALGALRLSLGPATTEADVDRAAKAIADAVARLSR
jgi:cysteine desulfurase